MASWRTNDRWRRLRMVPDVIAAQADLAQVEDRITEIHAALKRHDPDEKCRCDRCKDMRTELYGKASHRAQ